MSLSLQELMKKAADKGITAEKNKKDKSEIILRPWQQESVLFKAEETGLTEEIRTGKNQKKPRTNLGQSWDKPRTTKEQEIDKPRTEPRTNPRTNLGQTQDKCVNNTQFSSLVGLQRNIAIFIYESCKISRGEITSPLSLEHIAICCKTTKLSAQKTIQRLEKKGIILRNNFKTGRSGWTQYLLPKTVFQEIFQEESFAKPRTNPGQTKDKPKTEPRTEPRTTLSSSSSNIYINNTTTEEGENEKLDLEHGWSNIALEKLIPIGFTEEHLKQIFQKGQLSVEQVQDSIFAFAFDLEHNHKAKHMKGSPLNYFMGILRNGRVYTPPANYESPVEKSLRLYYERKKELDVKRQEMEEGLFDLEFKEWERSVSDEEKNKLLPDDIKNSRFSGAKLSALKSYFKEEVWPEKLQSILNNELLQTDLIKAI